MNDLLSEPHQANEGTQCARHHKAALQAVRQQVLPVDSKWGDTQRERSKEGRTNKQQTKQTNKKRLKSGILYNQNVHYIHALDVGQTSEISLQHTINMSAIKRQDKTTGCD